MARATSCENPGTILWQPIIRARYAHDIDAYVASSIVREVAKHGGRRLARRVAEAAFVGIASTQHSSEPADSSRLPALIAAADWDDGLCPAWWPWRDGRPAAGHDGESGDPGDPLLDRVLRESIELVRAAGSPSLQHALVPALTTRTLRRAADRRRS